MTPFSQLQDVFLLVSTNNLAEGGTRKRSREIRDVGETLANDLLACHSRGPSRSYS
jgi:hypothetical protein